IILQLGAVGVMAIGTFFWLILGKKIGLKERRLIMTDQNQTQFSGMVRLVKQMLIVLGTTELFAFLLLVRITCDIFQQLEKRIFTDFLQRSVRFPTVDS